MSEPIPLEQCLKIFTEGVSFAIGLAVALFFVRFWVRSHDRLFLYFAVAFGLMAFNRLVLTLAPLADETRTHFYWVRLVAYLLIILAIVEKNRGQADIRR